MHLPINRPGFAIRPDPLITKCTPVGFDFDECIPNYADSLNHMLTREMCSCRTIRAAPYGWFIKPNYKCRNNHNSDITLATLLLVITRLTLVGHKVVV